MAFRKNDEHGTDPDVKGQQGETEARVPTAADCLLILDGEAKAENFTPELCFTCMEFDCPFSKDYHKCVEIRDDDGDDDYDLWFDRLGCDDESSDGGDFEESDDW